MSNEIRAPRCRGIFGFLFGHKFVKSVGDYASTWDYCWRCGMRAGTVQPNPQREPARLSSEEQA